MKFRKLRIAWSIMCGVACVLLLSLWVRSYWHIDQFGKSLSSTKYIGCQTIRGQFMFCYMNDPKFMADLEAGGFRGWSRGEVLSEDWIDDTPNVQNQSMFSKLFRGFSFAKSDFRVKRLDQLGQLTAANTAVSKTRNQCGTRSALCSSLQRWRPCLWG